MLSNALVHTDVLFQGGTLNQVYNINSRFETSQFLVVHVLTITESNQS